MLAYSAAGGWPVRRIGTLGALAGLLLGAGLARLVQTGVAGPADSAPGGSGAPPPAFPPAVASVLHPAGASAPATGNPPAGAGTPVSAAIRDAGPPRSAVEDDRAAPTAGEPERFASDAARILDRSDASAAALRALRKRAEAGGVSLLQAYRAVVEAVELHRRLLAAAEALPSSSEWERPHARLRRVLQLRLEAGEALLDATEPDGFKRLRRATELADEADRAGAQLRVEIDALRSPSPRPGTAR